MPSTRWVGKASFDSEPIAMTIALWLRSAITDREFHPTYGRTSSSLSSPRKELGKAQGSDSTLPSGLSRSTGGILKSVRNLATHVFKCGSRWRNDQRRTAINRHFERVSFSPLYSRKDRPTYGQHAHPLKTGIASVVAPLALAPRRQRGLGN